jgi:tungstate transport system substrate-binding protein
MNHKHVLAITLLVLVAPISFSAEEEFKVAVIGGLELSGVWPHIAEISEKELDMQITTVLAAPKEQVVPAFMRGEADLLLIHGGDETLALQALGYAAPLRTWGYNDFVFVGPVDDPAEIAQAASGREAIMKIQSSNRPLILFRDPGSFQILKRLLDEAGLTPGQLRLLPDTAARPQQILEQAAREQAYVVVGHIPVAFGRMPSGGTSILFSGDPGMRRAYVVVTPGPRHPANQVARDKAERLTEYLLSEQGQALLQEIGDENNVPWIYPRLEAAALLQFPERGRQRLR